MASRAIDRCLTLRVAAKAVPHVQINCPHCRRLLQHIAMAIRARHARAYVRRVIEPDVGRGVVVVNPHPGNVFAARLIGRHLLDFGPVLGNHQMTTHAELHARDRRIGTLIHAGVAGLTLQSSSEMHLVREGNWLDGLGGVAIQKIAYRRSHASVSRRKSALCLRFLGSVNASPRGPCG
jgi:hypothetical protein